MIANVVMGVPSIIVGVFVYAILVHPLRTTPASPDRWRWRSSCCP